MNLHYIGSPEGLMSYLKEEISFWENYTLDDHRVIERYSEEDLQTNNMTQ